jgi:hypothetical protein
MTEHVHAFAENGECACGAKRVKMNNRGLWGVVEANAGKKKGESR